jgi:hypothetical protein
MKQVATIAVLMHLFCGILAAQNIVKESFDYPEKDSLDGIGGWFSSNVIKSKVKIVTPGLTYSGYSGGGIGNAVKFANVDNGDVCTKQLVKIDTGSVYLSYLVRVDSMTAAATSGYNITMDQYGGATNVNLKSYLQRVTDSTFKIGVTKYQGPVYINKAFKTKQTYLVVLRYQFVPGAANDTAKIYVFTAGVPVAEPAKADTFSAAGTDAADIGEIWLSNSFAQSGLKGSPVTLDEIRVGTTWSGTVLEPAPTVLTEDFYFAQGDTLRGRNGWDVYYGGTPLAVDSLGLSYAGYNGSGKGRSMHITGGSGSHTLYRMFPSVGDTNVYLSFLVNVSGTNAAQGFFTSLTNSSAGNYRAVVYAKIESGKLQFGLRPTLSGTLVFDTTGYIPGKTYLIVVKYSYIAGANNDEVSMFIMASGVPASEPSRANVGPLVMPNDNITLGAVALNSGAFTSGGPLAGSVILVDGIRVTKEVWKSGLTQVRTAGGTVPAAFVLEQNYPNPFNPVTTIGFTLHQAGVTTLTVYNSVGQQVATLVNEYLEAGKQYQRSFDASRLSSGVYFVRLVNHGRSEMKKMMLLK